GAQEPGAFSGFEGLLEVDGIAAEAGDGKITFELVGAGAVIIPDPLFRTFIVFADGIGQAENLDAGFGLLVSGTAAAQLDGNPGMHFVPMAADLTEAGQGKSAGEHQDNKPLGSGQNQKLHRNITISCGTAAL